MDVVVNWAKLITDWHEEFSPNELIAKEMDYHNNRIGREVFRKDPTMSDVATIEFFKELATNSEKIIEVETISHHLHQFVHLVDFSSI